MSLSRGFLPESFETGPLKVEFPAASGEVSGKDPAMSGPAAHDRPPVCPDRDRCMVMEYARLILCHPRSSWKMELTSLPSSASMSTAIRNKIAMKIHDSSRRRFVRDSLATSMSFCFAGLMRAHGGGGGATTTYDPENSANATTYATTDSAA